MPAISQTIPTATTIIKIFEFSKKEGEESMRGLKDKKYSGVDNILSELLKH